MPSHSENTEPKPLSHGPLALDPRKGLISTALGVVNPHIIRLEAKNPNDLEMESAAESNVQTSRAMLGIPYDRIYPADFSSNFPEESNESANG